MLLTTALPNEMMASLHSREPNMTKRKTTWWGRFAHNVRTRLVSGLLVLVPLGVTLFILKFLYEITAGIFVHLVKNLFNIVPGVAPLPGIVPAVSIGIFLAMLYVVGVVTTYVVGRRTLALGEAILVRIPIIRTVYSASKQVVDTLTMRNRGSGFKSVALIEFPRPGLKVLVFVTGKLRIGEEEYCEVFVPTTPNPTSGYLQLVPVRDVCETTLSLDEAMRIVMSGGILSPDRIELSSP
jgi:uncharacterized membrane protein